MMKFDAAPTIPGRAKIVDQNGTLPSAKSTQSGCACGSPQGSGNGEDACTPHPTQKPLELFERPVLNHTQPGELVYDPFAGSGTSLIACERHARRCYAIELDPGWCDVIRDRYQHQTEKGAGA